MRGAAQNLALLLGAAVFALVVAELGLRLFLLGSLAGPELLSRSVLHVPHPVVGWVMAPDRDSAHASGLFLTRVRTNSKGLRDREHDYVPAPGVVRIVVLGDSFMEGYGVEEHETMSHLLERELASHSVEVINMGTDGFSTTQEYLFLREEGLKYEPEIVALALYAKNDMRSNSRALELALWREESYRSYGRPYLEPGALGDPLVFVEPEYERTLDWLEQHRADALELARTQRFYWNTILYHLLRRRLLTWMQTPTAVPAFDPNVFFGMPFQRYFAAEYAPPGPELDYEALWEESWLTTRRLILATRDLANRENARFLLLYVPAKVQVDEVFRAEMERRYPRLAFDPWRVNRRLADFAKEHGVVLVDPSDDFNEAHSRGQVLFNRSWDRHWSAEGHAVAARRLADEVRARFLTGMR